MDYEIREYRPGDEEGILPSFNRVFREVCGDSYVDRDMEFWRWQFERNPTGLQRIMVGVAPDGVIASHYGGVPQKVHTPFGELIFVHIVDSFVVPEHRAGLRRMGLFVNTGLPWEQLCRKLGDGLAYGYPVKTAERISRRFLGCKLLRVINYLYRDADGGGLVAPSGVEVTRVAQFPAEVDALFEEFKAERQCLLVRDRKYLDWRYLQIPGDDYQIFAARKDGELRGLMVLRPEHELVPDSCTIADWIVPDGQPDVVDGLLAKTAEVARDRGRKALLAVFADTSPEHAALIDRGFVTRSSGEWLERRLSHHIFHPEVTAEWLAGNWWYTLGDSDLV